uniref:Uncharacterized protein n=1 Tax=viral metagenome TaxID=1070528 RepID=A0A6M3Y024_9ZZZZ
MPKMGVYTKADADADIAVHAADLDAHMMDFLQLLRTGEYLGYPFHKGAVDWAMSANVLYASPFYIARKLTVDRIAINVITAGIAGTRGRLGIYNLDTNLYPGALIVDGGEVAVDAVAVVAATINQALTKGIYFTALVSNGTPSIKTLYSTWTAMGEFATDLVTVKGAWTVTFTYAALPNLFTAGGALTSHTPVILPRVKSLD